MCSERGKVRWVCVTISHFTLNQLTHGEKKGRIHKPTKFKENISWITSVRNLECNTRLQAQNRNIQRKAGWNRLGEKKTYGPLSQQQQRKKHVSGSFLITLQVLILTKY